MPLYFWLCAGGLGLSIAMIAAIVGAARKPGGRPAFLALVFLEAAAFFLSALVASLPGGASLSAALSYCCSLIGLPSLYLYERAVVGETGRRALRHYLPALANLPVGLYMAVLGSRGESGMPFVIYYAALTVAQTAQLVIYGRAAIRLARGYGGRPNWLLHISRAVLAAYGVVIALGWAILGLLAAEEIVGYDIETASWIDPIAVMTVVFLAWTLGLCLVWGRDQSSGAGKEERKYGGRPLPEAEATALVRRARALLAAEADLSSESAQPRSLAGRLGVPYYALSRAVNELEGASLLELVNEYRVERAKSILINNPEASVIDACFEAGFQAKSTFNQVFMRRVGMSPREYRRARAPSA